MSGMVRSQHEKVQLWPGDEAYLGSIDTSPGRTPHELLRVCEQSSVKDQMKSCDSPCDVTCDVALVQFLDLPLSKV